MVWFIELQDRVVLYQINPANDREVRALAETVYADRVVEIRIGFPTTVVFNSAYGHDVVKVWPGD